MSTVDFSTTRCGLRLQPPVRATALYSRLELAEIEIVDTVDLFDAIFNDDGHAKSFAEFLESDAVRKHWHNWLDDEFREQLENAVTGR